MNAVYEQSDARASGVADRVIDWRHHLRPHPELSNREINTATLIADHLRSLELDEVRSGIAGHGGVGVLRGTQDGQRVIALRADTDALPVPDLCGVALTDAGTWGAPRVDIPCSRLLVPMNQDRRRRLSGKVD